MAKREIRISIFYTDLFVFDFARHKRWLEQMIKSSNDFFGKYKLRLDSFPFSYNYTMYKDAFVLAERDGIKPDIGQDQLAKNIREDSARSDKLDDEEADPNTTDARKAEIREERKRLRRLMAGRGWEGFNDNAEYDFRLALGKRFAGNKTLKKYEKDWKKAPRLTIVLCEFINLPERSQMNRDVIGQYVPVLNASTIKAYKSHKKPIPDFTKPFIIMDIRAADWSTLAHEIVHGNGHVHPSGHGTHAGYYDGPQESIMNYFSQGEEPSKVILEDADLEALEKAFFVRE